ncbi:MULTISPECIES: hypothetical protein [unclassified Pseudocitrobacter]|uniref:hypothetical protein n=1 Tax=unclassified Pseudocitrobacter TaxID=2638778 RepID=UPI0023E3D30E|nr:MULTISPECIES: hypothetical protein [unclassified Pseudocitrobacter]MDF3826328.1 hypothetical protein [Pseudocitrobacter sp. 2023EL-00150]MEC5372147.1 hypothetical protein [Pseudocitrobacter sp. MW920760]
MNTFSSIRLNQVRAAPSNMMIRIWFSNAIMTGLTPVVAWLAIISGVQNLGSRSGMCMFNLVLIVLISFWVDSRRDKFSTFLTSAIGVVLIVLVGTTLSMFFSIQGIATVFGIVSVMFALNALMSLFLGWNPGSRWLILLMAISGSILAVIINSLLGSYFSVWIMSILAVLVWPLAVGYKCDVLSELSRKLFAAEFSTMSRCMVLGSVITYLSALSLFCQAVMFLLEALFSSV